MLPTRPLSAPCQRGSLGQKCNNRIRNCNLEQRRKHVNITNPKNLQGLVTFRIVLQEFVDDSILRNAPILYMPITFSALSANTFSIQRLLLDFRLMTPCCRIADCFVSIGLNSVPTSSLAIKTEPDLCSGPLLEIEW